MKARRKEANYFRQSIQGYYIVSYKINGQLHVDKWDQDIRPSYLFNVLKHRGATDITLCKR